MPLLRTIIKTSISLALIVFSLYLLDWSKLTIFLQRLNPSVFLGAIGLALLSLFIMGYRWYLLIATTAPTSLLRHLAIYCYGSFLNSFTPANVGGDAYRIVALKSFASGGMPLFIAVIRERIIGLQAYFVALVAGLIGVAYFNGFSASGQQLFLVSGGLALCGILGIALAPLVLGLISRHHLISKSKRLSSVFSVLRSATDSPSARHSLSLLALSLLALFAWISVVRLVTAESGEVANWYELAVVVVLTELIRMLPVSIQGIGVREGMYAYLFTLLGKSAEAGFLVGAVSYMALSCSLILSGLIGRLMMPFCPEHKPLNSLDLA